MKAIVDAWAHADLAYYYPSGKEMLLRHGEFIPMRGRLDFGYISLDHKHKETVVSFQGTDLAREWRQNLRCLTTDKKGFAFTAFSEPYLMDFKPFVEDCLNMYPDYSISFRGHSRGGAIAGNAAMHIAEAGVPNSCITFGEPPPFTKEGRDYVNKLPIDYTWVKNGWDIVCSAVPHGKHAGKLYQLKQPFWHRFLPFRIADHTKYARRVRNLFNKLAKES